MLGLEKKTIHAIEAMLTIASYTGTQPISGKEIAAEHELPPRYLEQVLQKLVKAELLRGVRGPRGGYVLAREKRRISLANIIAAAEVDNDNTPHQSAFGSLNQVITNLQTDLTKELESYSLQELAPTKEAPKKTADFAI